MTQYVCSKCGGSSTEVNLARPSLDDRYPVGHCLRCTPWPKANVNPFKPNEVIQPPRKSVALVRADLFDRDAFQRRQMVAAKRALAAKLDAKHPVKMPPEQLAEAHAAASWLAGFTEEP